MAGLGGVQGTGICAGTCKHHEKTEIKSELCRDVRMDVPAVFFCYRSIVLLFF